MANTSEVQMTQNNYGVTTYLKFKYEAKRSSDAKNIIFKIEPQIRYSGSTTANAAVVFYNSDYPTNSSTSTVTNFTHSCACNKTYSGKSGNSYKYNWYGATGTSTASASDDYPVNGDAWVYGNWDSITVPVDPSKTSITLYFNFSNTAGYGNYENNGTGSKIWSSYGAKNYRFGVTFTVPLGYTSISAPGKPTISLDKPKLGTTDAALDHFQVQWTAPTDLGINNGVASYAVHAGYIGDPLGTGATSAILWKEYATGLAPTTTSQMIYRNTLVSKIGNLQPNTRATSPTAPTKWWQATGVRIVAVDKYGNRVHGEGGLWQCYWNERPTAPTAIAIENTGGSAWQTGNVLQIDMSNYSKAQIKVSGSIDRWLPKMPTSYDEASKTFAKNYRIQFTSSASMPEESQFDTALSAAATSGALTSEIKNDKLLGSNPTLGKGSVYFHARAWDGQLYSAAGLTQEIQLGKRLVLDGNITNNIISTGDGRYLLSKDSILYIPPTYLDGLDGTTKHYLSSDVKETIDIYGYYHGATAKHLLYSTTRSRITSGTTEISVSNFLNDLITQMGIDFTGNRTEYMDICFDVEITPTTEKRLATRFTDSHIYSLAPSQVTANMGWVDNNNLLFYGYGQVSPRIESTFEVAIMATSLPEISDNQTYSLTYSIDYALLGTSSSPTDSSVSWYTYKTGTYYSSDTIKIETININQLSSAIRESALKFRVRITDPNTTITRYIALYWPGLPDDASEATKCQYATVKKYRPTYPIAQIIGAETSIIEDDDDIDNKNKVSVEAQLDIGDLSRFGRITFSAISQINSNGAILTIGNPNIFTEYFSGNTAGDEYAPPTFGATIFFNDINELGNFKIEGVKISCNGNEVLDSLAVNDVSYPANRYLNLSMTFSYSEIFKATPGWTKLDIDGEEGRDYKIVGNYTTGESVFLSSYADAKYEELSMSSGTFNRWSKGGIK